jgi:hypothetical protein
LATVPFPESPRGDVRVEGDAIFADGIAIRDAELAEIVRQAPESRRLELVERAIRVGLTAIGNDMTSRLRESMQFVHSTLDQQVASFGERIAGRVREQLGDADTDGHVQRRVNEILARWAAQLKADFERSLPDVFDGQTKKSVERIQAEGERVLKQITALFSENGIAFNELREVRRDFAQRLEEVKTTFTVGQTKAANPSPRDAGLGYEAAIHQHLATIGMLRGDDVEDTANKVGKVPNCKKGDTRILPVVTGIAVVGPPCIVVEIRDREDSEFSLADVDMMMRNRESNAAMVVAAHAGSLPKQYAGQSFAVSWQKRLITVVLDPDSPDAEVVLAAAYNLACVLAIEAVRQSRDGDWDAMSRKIAAIEQEIEGINETRGAFDQIEKKAHDAGVAAGKRHASLVRLVAELAAIIRGQQ